MWEKLSGLAIIVVTITVLCLLHLLNLPTAVQILCGVAGSIFCLIGIVFLFSEGQLLAADHWIKEYTRVKKAVRVG